MNTSIQWSELVTEFGRVFGSAHESGGGLRADGWPDAVQYDADRALPVLRRYSDGYATADADADAEVCAALERAGGFRGLV